MRLRAWDVNGGVPLGPGALAERISALRLTVESVRVMVGAAAISGYEEDATRPTGFVTLAGLGAGGTGECVAWTPEEQARFANACPMLVPIGATTVGALHGRLAHADRYQAAAIEAAAIDLALRQAATNPFAMAHRPVRRVAYCRSLNAGAIAVAGGAVEAVSAALEAEPNARIKIDAGADPWPAAIWRELAQTGRVVVVDFKRRGEVADVALAHRWLPNAWIEDPPPTALVHGSPWRARVALDSYVRSAADLAPPPVAPGAVNVKAARMGGPIEALRVLEVASRAGWWSYVGGMFEVGVGRLQARVLASLFTADAWNDVAPLDAGPPASTTRLELPQDFVGFAPDMAGTAPAGISARVNLSS